MRKQTGTGESGCDKLTGNPTPQKPAQDTKQQGHGPESKLKNCIKEIREVMKCERIPKYTNY